MSLRTCALAPIFLITASFANLAEEPVKPLSGEVVLQFLEDRSLGEVYCYVKDGDGEGKHFDARGEVRVPADSNFGLLVSQPGCADLSPLSLAVQSGLKKLYFRHVQLPPAAIEQIAALDGVEYLDFLTIDMTDDDLAQLAELRTLKHLLLFHVPVSDEGIAKLTALPLEQLSLYGTKVTDRVWQSVARFKSLKDLRLGDRTISDAGFKVFRELPHLESLFFDNLTEITDEGMTHLTTLPQLKSLTLHGRPVKISETAFLQLSKLKNLIQIDLSNTTVTDEMFLKLEPLEKLSGLRLPDRLTGAGTGNLSRFAALSSLDCTCDGAADATLAEIAKLPKLTFLNLSGDGVTDEGMKSLAKNTTLTGLFIQHCQVGDEGLARLAPLKSLSWLLISSTNVTSDGLKHLTQFPALKSLCVQDLAGDNSDLSHLGKLTQLTQLDVTNLNRDGAPFNESDLDFLAGMKDLRRLELDQFGLSDAGVERLTRLESLEYFQYRSDDSQMTDQALVHLAAMPKLREISLSGRFSDQGLEYLAKSRSLKRVDLENPRQGLLTFTPEAVARLRKHMTVEVPEESVQVWRRPRKWFEGAPPAAAIKMAVADAANNQARVLVVLGDPDVSAVKALTRLFEQPDVYDALNDYEPVSVLARERQAFAQAAQLPEEQLAAWKLPALVALDENAQVDANTVWQIGAETDLPAPQELVEYFQRHRITVNAAGALEAALAQARQENKRVLVRQTGGEYSPRAVPRFVESQANFFASEYVIVTIDPRRFVQGRQVMKRLRPQGGEPPWIAILDDNGRVLVTSDGPQGAIYFPPDAAGVGYLMHMFESTAQHSTPDQLQSLRAALEKISR